MVGEKKKKIKLKDCYEFKVNLGYRPCLSQQKTNKQNKVWAVILLQLVECL